MRFNLFTVFVVVALLLSWSHLSAGDVNIGKIGKAQWRSLESEHFFMVTDAKEIQAVQMLSELERFNYFVTLILGIQDKEIKYKVPIVAANSSKSFKALGLSNKVSGVFVRNELGEKAILVSSKNFKSSNKGASLGRHIILHEITHLIMDQAEFNIAHPPWYREGIAEYFGTYRETSTQIVLGDTSILKNRFYSVFSNSGQYQSVNTEELFNYSHISIDSNASQKELENFYARAFAVVHFMNADPDRKDAMMRYLHARYSGATVDEAFKYAFNITFEQLDEYVDQYIKGKYMYGRVFEKGMFGVKFPSFDISNPKDISSVEAITFITEKLSYFSDDFLGAGVKEKMQKDLENLTSKAAP